MWDTFRVCIGVRTRVILSVKARLRMGSGLGRRNVLFNDALNTYYLRLYGDKQNYGKGPFRYRERKPAAAI